MKINEKFEIEFGGNCWLLYEWKHGFKNVGDERVPTLKKTGPTFHTTLPSVCSVVIDRSAGHACANAENIISAIRHAKIDLVIAISGGGWR